MESSECRGMTCSLPRLRTVEGSAVPGLWAAAGFGRHLPGNKSRCGGWGRTRVRKMRLRRQRACLCLELCLFGA